MTLEILRLTLGVAATNAYLIGDTEFNEAVLIDPVDNADILYGAAEERGWTIRLILATHAHFDHILASQPLKDLTDAPFAIHADAVPMLRVLAQQGLRIMGQVFPPAAEPDRLLTTEPETIRVGAIRLETLFTPGHAPGHIAFYMREQGIVFSGDALFAGSIGRTDLPGGDHDLLLRSIQTQLLTLPDETVVLSGHGDATTIEEERAHNPFLRALA